MSLCQACDRGRPEQVKWMKKRSCSPDKQESRIALVFKSLVTDQLADVLIELLIGLMSGIVWIPEFVES